MLRSSGLITHKASLKSKRQKKKNNLLLGIQIKPPSWITALSWQRGLHNSMKLQALPCRAAQDGWVRVESSDKKWSTARRGGKPLQYSCHENNMNCIKRQKDMIPKDEPPGQKVSNMLLGKSGEQLPTAPERMKLLGQNRNSTQLWMCWVKETYSIGTWNVRSMNQGQWQEMARVNIDILGISELEWSGMGEFNSDDIISTTVGNNPVEEMEWPP